MVRGVRIGGIKNRKPGSHRRAVRVGRYFEVTAQLAHSLPHRPNADSRCSDRSEDRNLLCRDAGSKLEHYDQHSFIDAPATNLCNQDSRIAMNVGEALLDDAKHRCLYIPWQSPEIIRAIEFDFDMAALSESVNIPTNRRSQPSLVEKW